MEFQFTQTTPVTDFIKIIYYEKNYFTNGWDTVCRVQQ